MITARRLPHALAAAAAILSASCEKATPEHRDESSAPVRLFSETPPAWFEGFATTARIAPDGRWAIYADAAGAPRILDLKSGRPVPEGHWAGIDSAWSAGFGPRGRIAWLGRRGTEVGWFTADSAVVSRLEGVPKDARPEWSRDGRVAWTRSRGTTEEVVVGSDSTEHAYALPARAVGVAWAPDGSSLAITAADTNASVRLLVLDLRDGRVRTVARQLDGAPFLPILSVAPDGRHAFLALASGGAPPLEVRHEPNVDRDLAVYAVDLVSGNRSIVADTPGEDFAPEVAGRTLYWTSSAIEHAAVVLPATGGAARIVAGGGELPTWRPDGKQIGFTYGAWRMADWALNLDGAVVNVDERAIPISSPRPSITGYHEDFSPVWSPDGRWVAFHSHRTRTPVASYLADATDDIWLRHAGAPAIDSTERRLTDFGWEAGSPDWSRDGTRMVFTSWVKGGAPYASFAWTVTIDPRTGKPVGHGRLPLPAPIHGAELAAWSPTGGEIAIEEKLDEQRHALWVIGTDGSRPRKVVEYAMQTYGGVDWMPDGQSLVYSAVVDNRMQLFMVSTDGGTPRQLTKDSANLLHPQVSPDGKFIAASRILQKRAVWSLELPR
jgi:Tol biopolymer transport system component